MFDVSTFLIRIFDLAYYINLLHTLLEKGRGKEKNVESKFNSNGKILHASCNEKRHLELCCEVYIRVGYSSTLLDLHT
jgi:hypothetical protein